MSNIMSFGWLFLLAGLALARSRSRQNKIGAVVLIALGLWLMLGSA